MASVQFKGLESVLAAYENRNVPAWSLWQGKQFMFKYEGTDIAEGAQILSDTLEMLARSSNAIYTLKIYEELTGGKIKSNTADDGSFNFKLDIDTQEISVQQYGSIRQRNEVLERLEAIENRITEREQQDQEAPPANSLGMIGELLQLPAVQPLIQPLLSNILGKIMGSKAPATGMPAAAISGIEGGLNDAISELQQADGNLPAHLSKLAAIAKNDPATFKQLLLMLENVSL